MQLSRVKTNLSVTLSVALLIVCVSQINCAEEVYVKSSNPNCRPKTTTTTTTKPSTFTGIPLGHGPVCNPRCVGYAGNNQKDKFLSDRCCVFLPCPLKGADAQKMLKQYQTYKSNACKDSTTTTTGKPTGIHSHPPITVGPPRHGIPTPPPNDGTSSKPVTIKGPSFQCNPRCIGYYQDDDSTNFKAENCCVIAPCPINCITTPCPGTGGPDDASYNAYKSRVC